MKVGRLALKVVIIGLLIALLSIGIGIFSGTLEERKGRYREAVDEIGAQWGHAQQIAGPYLRIPIADTTKSGTRFNFRTLILTPTDLNINVSMENAQRYRGIYRAQVYESVARFTGSFSGVTFQSILPRGAVAMLDQVTIAANVTDIRGIRAPQTLTVDGKTLEMQLSDSRSAMGAEVGEFTDGRRTVDILPEQIELEAPVHVSVAEDGTLSIKAFDLQMHLKGNQQFDVVPIGRSTKTTITSNWPHPSFFGAALPDDHRISDDGFKATWTSSQFGRGFDQSFVPSDATNGGLAASAFGVSFVEPVDVYHRLERSTKYVLLVIILTFALFFVLESVSDLRIHPMQYLFVGLALVVFYLLLIATSEVIAFGTSYLLSMTATVLLVSAYMKYVVISWSRVAFVGVSLAGLFGFVFVLLTEETYSLLLGSIGLFVMVALLMYATRKVDWYSYGSEPKISEPTDH